MKEFIARIWARRFAQQQRQWMNEPALTQRRQLSYLIDRAKDVSFGKEHYFSRIKNYSDFKKAVPLRKYEDFSPYIDRIFRGESDVIWPGRPRYFALTSGTTLQSKYIPITLESLRYQISTARAALLHYVYVNRRTDFLRGRIFHYSASPQLQEKGGIPTGLLSGIVHNHVPFYVRRSKLPSLGVNSIPDHLSKLDAIIAETHHRSVSLLAGIPIWVQEYLDKLCDYTGKQTVMEIFPELALYMYGGTSLEPYRHRMMQRIGKQLATLELYPASEGFFAYQDLPDLAEGLLLQLAHGMFYEFVPLSEISKPSPSRYDVSEVEINKPYALVVSSNAGLWGYMIGDVVSFTSLRPCRVRMVGRTGHYLSAFNEHLIAEEVERAVSDAVARCPETRLIEYTVAPYISPQKGKSYHQWLMAFETPPQDEQLFIDTLDQSIQGKNVYYKNLRKAQMLSSIRISFLQADAFMKYMQSIGKLDPQKKLPRLSNDRKIADALGPYILKTSSVHASS